MFDEFILKNSLKQPRADFISANCSHVSQLGHWISGIIQTSPRWRKMCFWKTTDDHNQVMKNILEVSLSLSSIEGRTAADKLTECFLYRLLR